jgi:hypothetical protein
MAPQCPKIEAGIRHMLRQVGAADLPVVVRWVDAIKRTALGKLKTVVLHQALRHKPSASDDEKNTSLIISPAAASKPME